MSGAARQTHGRAAQVIVPVADLLRQPDGPRDRQLLFGERVQVDAVSDGWSHVEADKDGYAGYVVSGALGPTTRATHWVHAPATHVYTTADLKSPDRMALSFGSRVSVLSWSRGYGEIPGGFVPRVHLTPEGTGFDDSLEVAALFLGTPYLWGGNSRFGIDCSGLIQAAWLACGLPCPGDSGAQMQALGQAVPVGSAPVRGDLLFWKRHVAMVHAPDTLLHANAFHMAVQFEPLGEALARIESQGDGRVLCHLRPA